MRYEARGDDHLERPDVRIEGGGYTLIHNSQTQPNNGELTRMSVDLTELHFENEDSGSYATREEFMRTLVNIQSIQIRGTYKEQPLRAEISDVSMDTAAVDGLGAVASNVEQCQCPPNYSGTSCERCANGYFLEANTGRCVPCQCNGRSESCDPITGSCTVKHSSASDITSYSSQFRPTPH